jgi:hypothetical protein
MALDWALTILLSPPPLPGSDMRLRSLVRIEGMVAGRFHEEVHRGFPTPVKRNTRGGLTAIPEVSLHNNITTTGRSWATRRRNGAVREQRFLPPPLWCSAPPPGPHSSSCGAGVAPSRLTRTGQICCVGIDRGSSPSHTPQGRAENPLAFPRKGEEHCPQQCSTLPARAMMKAIKSCSLCLMCSLWAGPRPWRDGGGGTAAECLRAPEDSQHPAQRGRARGAGLGVEVHPGPHARARQQTQAPKGESFTTLSLRGRCW